MDYKNYNPRAAALAQARTLLTDAVKAAVADGTLPEAALPDFIVEIPADVKNGDIASNVAMAGARAFHKAPRQIAEAITAKLQLDGSLFDRFEVAGPGFINLFLGQDWFTSVVRAAVANPEYGRTDAGAGKKYNVEFVSANPTGPMHMGNARGGALGDGLAACLDWAGYDVTREFYINDAGNQIEKFGKSLAIRYLQLYKGEDACPLPEECYQGADIIARAKEFAEVHGDAYVNKDFDELKKAIVADALPKNIAGLQRDLGKYRIQYDVWFHESDLHSSGAVKAVVDKLLESGACYKAEDGAIMYRSAQYAAKYGVVNKRKTDDGSEEEAKDEVLVRANGIPTYFAADIAYHYNKLAVRGFDKAIDVWGADHHGHVARMKGAMDAIGLDGSRLDIVLMQMVNLMRDGKPVRMSKRTGKAITLTDLLDEVPIDSARFFFNQRESSSTLDFDLDLAVRNDSENPVYYVQYAHARICSVLKKLESEGVKFEGADAVDASVLTGVVNKRKTDDGSEEEAKDEVLVRANGIPTYFAADIAYHYNKLAVRGFDKAIDVWGADHHGHVARMKGAMDAIGLDGSRLDIVLMQMVNLMRDGKPVRMSKRTGKAITLTDLLDEVPIDSARFFFNQRESSSTLDFDLDLAVRNDSENPVYYVQYAHARICSVLKKLESEGVKFEGADAVDASVLTDPAEQALIRLLAAFPAEITAAAEKYDPARITRYCIDVASAYHRFYNACRILDAEGAVQQGRIALCLAVRGVIHNILTMFKVTAPETM